MISFKAELQKFYAMGEKTGWTYIQVPAKLAQKLNPDSKRSFRIKGSIDAHPIKCVALVPMGEGNYIMPVNASMRKAIKKIHGASVEMKMERDESEIKLSPSMLACLKDVPSAFTYFKGLPLSHQHWFSNWVNAAKTEPTKVKRIATIVRACEQLLSFPEMMKAYRDERDLTR